MLRHAESMHLSLKLSSLAFLTVALPGIGQAQLETSSLLINLKAGDFSTGGSWNQSGESGAPGISGSFSNQGSTPTSQSVAGHSAVYFDESDYFRGPLASAGLEGPNPTRTVEVWAYQGFIRSEEGMVSMGKRGGPDGSNNSFGYGSDSRWGAVGQWGGPDIGWGPVENGDGSGGVPPAAGQWHHLVYTFDGTTTRVYSDGVLKNSEAAGVSTHTGLPIQIGAQLEADGTTVTGGVRFGGAIGAVRIHDGALTGTQVLNNFNFEKGSYQKTNAEIATPLRAAPAHRWSFNEGSGTTFADSQGGATATLRGAGATVTATGVDLPGGSASTQAYIDLPNGVASGTFGGGTGYKNGVTYETWVTTNTPQNWSRVFDFGATTLNSDPANPVEITGPGGGDTEGVDYLTYTNNTGGDANNQLERQDFSDPANPRGSRTGISRQIQGQGGLAGTQQHLAVVYDDANDEWRFYRNGVLMEGYSDVRGPDSLNDLNNWLGRSQWSGDANLDGTFDEFRIYDYDLTHEEVIQNFLDGANKLTVVPEPAAAGLAGLAGLGWLTRRRRK